MERENNLSLQTLEEIEELEAKIEDLTYEYYQAVDELKYRIEVLQDSDGKSQRQLDEEEQGRYE